MEDIKLNKKVLFKLLLYSLGAVVVALFVDLISNHRFPTGSLIAIVLAPIILKGVYSANPTKIKTSKRQTIFI